MAIDSIFDSASNVMTVISLVTFLGILWWTFGVRRSADFDAAALVPFADDTDTADAPPLGAAAAPLGKRHV